MAIGIRIILSAPKSYRPTNPNTLTDEKSQELTSITLVHSDILDNDPCSLLLRICTAANIDPKRVLFVIMGLASLPR